MSGQLYYLRTRSLQSYELNTTCYKTFVDGYFTDSLYVLDLYDNGQTGSLRGYNVYSFAYANLASTIKIETVTSAYLKFTQPTFTS